MRTPNTFQIGSTTYTTREYCNARGITDNATILKIQWRINTYTRNHTIQQTIEELKRLTLRQDGIRPWQGTKKEREIAEQEKSKLLKQAEWMNIGPSNTTPINVPDAKDGIKITIYDNISSLPQANGKWPDKRLRENHHPTSTSTPPIIEETNITDAPDRLREAYRSLKLYADAIEKKKTIQYKIDTLEAELKDAQKEVEKWSTNAAALLQDV